MPSSSDFFLARVAAYAGVEADRAGRATRAVLSGIAAYLPVERRELVARELPPSTRRTLLDTDARTTSQNVLVRGLTAGHARELIASVCRVLAEDLSFEAVEMIRSAVPPAIAILFGPPGSARRASSRDPRELEGAVR